MDPHKYAAWFRVVFCARAILRSGGVSGLLLLLTVGACNRSAPDPPAAAAVNLALDRPLRIEVRGKDFEWSFRYPGPDGKMDTDDDVLSHQQLHLPLGADVELALHSDDYIYTFSVPELTLKEVAVPELTFSLEFQSTRAGTFDLKADPMCGWRFLHDESMGRMIVESVDQFEQWYIGQRVPRG